MEVQESKQDSLSYKFRELKVYSSTEWLADNKKKYRQVLDRKQSAFIYAELSFFNKLFDEKNWDININLKCFNLTKNKKQVCNLELKKKVSKYDHTVYIREGWGNKKIGSFWAKGTYYWEAWINEEKVATKYFYIEEGDDLLNEDEEENSYIDLKSVKLYEGKYDDVSPEDRKYFTAFGLGETRYIYAEIEAYNQHLTSNWQCELFIKFFNQARELKGQVVRLMQVKENDKIIKFSGGWGANIKGSWRKGMYSVEVVFMDKVLGIMPFEVGEDFVEGQGIIQLPYHFTPNYSQPEEIASLTLEEIMAKLNGLIGLTHIKKKVKEHAQYLEFVQLRKEKGFKEDSDLSVHAVFTGNPGTGKTTVARMMGKIYCKMGLLSKGHVHEVDRVNLVGEYIGQTAPKVKDAIDKARGGILFIDEAYALARSNDDSKDFGREVIEILIKEMSDGIGDLAVIVAGYPAEMDYFLKSNPGLKSRFKINYEFDDYLPKELWEIVNFSAEEMELEITPEAKVVIDKNIIDAYRNRDRSFGNARYVHDLVEKAKMNLGLRIMNTSNPNKATTEDLKVITIKDVLKLEEVKKGGLPGIPVDTQLLESSLSELNELIGLESVKKEVTEIVDLVQYYQHTETNPLEKMSLHTVFVGNPGTGKTTVARILSNIFRSLGILERGHIVETDRQGLVAGYVGQTAIKTSKKIDESIGGILFIDEAYALSGNVGVYADYGHEAIQTLLKRMEDDRGKFFVIAAGYPDNMKKFLGSNPGLRSRFDKIIKFEDYSPIQLFDIAKSMLQQEKLRLSSKAADALKDIIQTLYVARDKYFGNAREIRKMVKQLITNQHLRQSEMLQLGKKADQNQIVHEDVMKLSSIDDNKIFNANRIGYNSKK